MSILSKQFRVIGVSHHNTPLELREKLSFQEGNSKEFLKNLSEAHGIIEAMIVSTCNRTEIYFTGDEEDEEKIEKLLPLSKGIELDEIEPYLRKFSGEEATEHLFQVSLGLDAKVLGDLQIINQVKKSYQWSADEEMAGPFLHRLMHTIFYANKRVIQETDFRDGSGSMASVAVDLIKTAGEMISDPRILLIGTGEIGQNVLENLGEDFTDVTIINRTQDRAEKLAHEKGQRFAPIENIEVELSKADVVIAAINADEPIITRDMVKPSLTQRLFIDLSIPRAIAPDVDEVQGAVLYNVDQIEERATEVLKRREKAKDQVVGILNEHIEEFGNWSHEMTVSPTIKLLKDKLEQIRQEEIARHLKKLTDKEIELVNVVTKNMIQKVIKLPVLELKAACKRGEAESLVEVLNDIFNLENSVSGKS